MGFPTVYFSLSLSRLSTHVKQGGGGWGVGVGVGGSGGILCT